jgi:plastocyanin
MGRYGVTIALAVFAFALAGSASADPPTLNALVGPGYNISLTDSTGTLVKHLDPGEYLINVNDQSDLHNFDLFGPGVTKATDVEGTGKQTWDVTFTDGTYTYQCDAHPTIMHGSFTVGTVTAPPPKPTTHKLAGSVGPGVHISFAHSAKAGKTVITIRDRSKKDNLHLTGPGVNKKTGVKFTGTVTWTLTLKAGTYTFRSDAHKALKGTLKVT